MKFLLMDISSQLDKQLADHAMDLWLVEETSRYMFRLLAVKEIFKNPQRYGFLLKKEHLYPPIPYKEITVTTPIANLSDFAKQQGITYAQLRDANTCFKMGYQEGLYGTCYFFCTFTGYQSDYCSSWYVNLVNFCTIIGGI